MNLRIQGLLMIVGLSMMAGCGKQDTQMAQKQEEKTPAQEPAKPAPVPAPAPSGIPNLTGDTVKTASGLKYIEVTVGTGTTPTLGQVVQAKYSGWLTNGTPFDAGTYSFPLGQGRVIRGWDEAFASMKVGGRRLLFIPHDLAYGTNGRPPRIPPSSTLVFDVELMSIQ